MDSTLRDKLDKNSESKQSTQHWTGQHFSKFYIQVLNEGSLLFIMQCKTLRLLNLKSTLKMSTK